MKKSADSLSRIVYPAFLIALEIVLNRFCSINTMGLKIGFSFVPIIVAARLFGPVTAAVVYGIGDLVGAILFPIGVYHPGFTVSAVLMGLLWGLFLYSPEGGRGIYIKWKKIRFFPNVIVPALVNNLVFGLVVNTKWVADLYGSKTYGGWFVYRLPEYAVLVPLCFVLVPAVLKLCDELQRIMKKGRK